jgi:hypothetical protein
MERHEILEVMSELKLHGMRASFDEIILDGNPLDGYWNLLNAKVVIKGGDVVVDKR